MDSLAHTLCGLALAESGPRRAYGARASWLLAIAANLPDADIVIRAAGYDAYVFHHRGVTHGAAGLAVQAAALAALWTMRDPERRWRPWLGLAALGLASHLLLDWVTSWGTMFLYPFSRERFALDWLAIIDPWVWGLLAAGLGAGWAVARHREALARAALAATVVYVGGCAASHALAEAQFRDALARIRVRAPRVDAFPQFLSPLRWNAVAATPGGTYQGDVHALRGLEGRLNLWFQADVAWTRSDTFTATYGWWARAPVLRLVGGAVTNGKPAPPDVVLFDLRFLNRVAGLPFVVRLDRGPAGAVSHHWYGWGEFPAPAPDQEYELPESR